MSIDWWSFHFLGGQIYTIFVDEKYIQRYVIGNVIWIRIGVNELSYLVFCLCKITSSYLQDIPQWVNCQSVCWATLLSLTFWTHICSWLIAWSSFGLGAVEPRTKEYLNVGNSLCLELPCILCTFQPKSLRISVLLFLCCFSVAHSDQNEFLSLQPLPLILKNKKQTNKKQLCLWFFFFLLMFRCCSFI